MVEHPSKYGLKLYRWQPEPVRKITVSADVADLQAFAKQHGTSYYVLQLYNPWLLSNTLTIKEGGGGYTIELPFPKTTTTKDSTAISTGRQ